MNTTSAVLGVGDIGLGNTLGSNILNIPILVLVAYIASKRYHKKELPTAKETVSYHAIPYLAFIGLVALITLPPEPIRGFQWYDGIILLFAYIVHMAITLKKGKEAGRDIDIPKEAVVKGYMGFILLAIGAFFAIVASQGLAHELGINQLITGLFVAAAASSLPEALASWHAVRMKESVAAVTSVIDDNIISITLALIPICLVVEGISDLPLFIISLVFVAITAVEYTIFAYTEFVFTKSEVTVLTLTYTIYILLILSVID